MKRHKLKKVEASKLIVNKANNYREIDNYDLQSMIESIKLNNGVLEPLHVCLETNEILRGNRRGWAVQVLLADPTITAELKSKIEELDVIYYEGMTPDEKMEFMLDHGSTKGLSCVEVVLAVWRLMTRMKGEKEIIKILYHALARYTGKPNKAYEAAALPEGEGRNKFLTDWLHGTVGNYIMVAAQLGETVREQFLLSERAKDRALTDEEKKQVLFSGMRGAIKKLKSAQLKDEKDAGWDSKTGGVEFNKVLAELIAQEKGEGPPKVSPPTREQMKSTAGLLKSDLRKAYSHCAGTLAQGEDAFVHELDVEMYRLEEIKKATAAAVDRINITSQFSGAEVREVMRMFLAGHATDYQEYIKRFYSEV